ncbi:MAG: hypothetical protein ABIM46_00605 [candidate division WOR-3 bacterium]
MIRVVRLDGGYYSNRNLSLLEEKGLSYAILTSYGSYGVGLLPPKTIFRP